MSPSHAATPSRRRPTARVSGEEREHAIIATLEGALTERPFHAISVDDLASGAGISRSTFYFYFASKEAVLVTLLERLVAVARDTTDQALPQLAQDPAGAWRRAIGASFAMWTVHRPVIRAAAEARTGDPEVRALWDGLLRFFIDRTAQAITAERDRGAAPAGIDARELALCLNRMNERMFEATLADEPLALPEASTPETLTLVWLRAIYGHVPAV